MEQPSIILIYLLTQNVRQALGTGGETAQG